MTRFRFILLPVVLLSLVALVAACGGGGGEDSGDTSTSTDTTDDTAGGSDTVTPPDGGPTGCSKPEDCIGQVANLGACEVAGCNDQGVCVAMTAPVGTGCDDGDACTADDVCSADGACAGTAVADCHPCAGEADCAAFEDGDACNGTLTCTGGTCQLGDPVTCDADTDCATYACNATTGACDATAINEGGTCEGDPAVMCGTDFLCEAGDCVCPGCEPACEGLDCGDDGCGGSCGDCQADEACVAGVCVPCEADCTDRDCGDDGCGGSCGTCEGTDTCNADGVCECVPECGTAVCGDDGCGGSCGACEANETCNAGVCECVPACDGKNCGDDGCEGSCGTCDTGFECSANQVCIPEGCVPACGDRECGADPTCGDSCGTCDPGYECDADGMCQCVPNCGDAVCGDDGCGGSCGDCDPGYECTVDGACTEIVDNCFGVDFTGCCEDGVVLWCEGGELQSDDCSQYDPNSLCGWSADEGFYGCTTEETSDPNGAPRDCPALECPTSCEDVNYACGTHPDCPFLDCGECTGDDVCDGEGACIPDPCQGVTLEGCCGEGGVIWCENNQINFLDCGEDGCGWYADANFFACGATDTPPAEIPVDCAAIECGTCADLGAECGAHPTCPWMDCGTCGDGQGCQAGTCVDIQTLTLTCDQRVTGNNAGGLSLWDGYDCSEWEATGPEVIYTFTPDATGDVAFYFDNEAVALEADVEIYVLAPPYDGVDCIDEGGYGDSGTVVTLEAGVTYYVVVDGYQGATSPYALVADCLDVCADPQCGDRECGPAPADFCAGIECGAGCADGDICTADGMCAQDPCLGISDVGCCQDGVTYWCAEGVLASVDCAANDASCGWTESFFGGYYDCGGEGEDPSGEFPLACEFDTCDNTSFCAAQGYECGMGCPGESCGECAADSFCTGDRTCQVAETCDGANLVGDIACAGTPETVSGDTSDSTDGIATFPGCTAETLVSPDEYYTFTPSCTGDVAVTFTAPAGMAVLVLEGECRGDAGFCQGGAVSQDGAPVEFTFSATADVTYYLVVDGFDGAAGAYELTVNCACTCEQTCGDRVCGPDPACGLPCGTCDAGDVCTEAGTCVTDPCLGASDVGCCSNGMNYYCTQVGLVEEDCGDAACGWYGGDFFTPAGYYCGGDGEDPSGANPLSCDFPVCDNTSFCAEMGYECGMGCPGESCGGCADGFFCDVDHTCVEAQVCNTDGFVSALDCTSAPTATGDNSAGPSEIDDYPGCGVGSETGPEVYHTITPPCSGEITVTLTGPDTTGDLDLMILEAECRGDGDFCIGYSAAGGPNEEVTFFANADTTYYLVVDGYDGAVGAYDIAISCACTCEQDCTDLACGPDPVCGQSCGECGDGEFCNAGTCEVFSAKTCATPAPIACGGAVSGSTIPAENLITDYSCVGFSDTGGEDVYSFTTAEAQEVTIELGTYTGDMDLFLLGADCDPDLSCIEDSTQGASAPTETITFTAEAGATYHITVDGYGGNASEYALSVTCGAACVPTCGDAVCGDDGCGGSCGSCDPGFLCEAGACVEAQAKTCATPATLACGDTLAGSTIPAADLISAYECTTYDESGGDDVYAFTAAETQEVTIELGGYGDLMDMELYLLGADCDPLLSCLDDSTSSAATETIVFTAEAGVTYHVVVDGYGGDAADYTLAATCAAPCVPECGAAVCGDDGCGGSCGSCDPGFGCDAGVCVSTCPTPTGEATCENAVFANDTTGGTSLVDNFCGDAGWSTTGPEHFYTFTAPADGTYSFVLYSDLPADHDLILLGDDCSTCLDMGDTEIVFDATAGESFYLVVDGYQGSAGTYYLHLLCADTVLVEIVDNAFDPADLTIDAGTTVRWFNTGANPHTSTSTSDPVVWDSSTIAPGGTFERLFDTAGAFPYECTIHDGMTGSITVQAPAK